MLVIRALTEPSGGRPMVVEVLEVDPAGHDRVLLVTSSSRLATSAVRDWLDTQDPAGQRSRQKTSRGARRADAQEAQEAQGRKGGRPVGG